MRSNGATRLAMFLFFNANIKQNLRYLKRGFSVIFYFYFVDFRDRRVRCACFLGMKFSIGVAQESLSQSLYFIYYVRDAPA